MMASRTNFDRNNIFRRLWANLVVKNYQSRTMFGMRCK